MKAQINKRKFIYIKMIMLLLVALCLVNKPITARAESISLSAVGFDDHRGMKAYINGKPVYCIQRGYPFRSSVSELQMVYIEGDGGLFVGEYEGTISSCIRYILRNLDNSGGSMELQYFRGWGSWTINGDHTDATQTSTAGAPTSNAWQEAFDEDKVDDEDDPYHNRYNGGNIRKFVLEVVARDLLTGHEGCVDVFPTTMKQISYSEAGFTMPQVYAQAITQYYIWEDPDAAGYSETVKYQVKQALDWGIELKFITTTGRSGDILRLIYKDSTGVYGVSGSHSYSGSCDGYIKTTIGSQYEAMKLYRQVVWKTTNMRVIPSFANKEPGNVEPIKLYWNEEQHLYTATVSDHNGVLDYFDFSVPGCTVTNNGDGTLTISASGAVSATSAPSKSGLEPEDGTFKLPDFYRWNLEGKRVTFKYTYLTADYDSQAPQHIYEEDGSGRRESFGSTYNHSHSYSPACNWFCTKPKDTVIEANHNAYASAKDDAYYNDCTGEDNAGYNDPDWTDENDFVHNGDHHYGHNHTDACHSCENSIKCQHQWNCPYYKYKRDGGMNDYINHAAALSDCTRVWCCGKYHYNTGTKEVTGKYIDWQDVSGVYARGQKLIDPEICYIKVETVPHEFPAETDTEILLIADNDEWNDLTYTAPNGKVIKHSSHLRVGEKFHLKYIYSYKGASKGFRIEFSLQNKPYYQYNYLSRMDAPNNNKPIYELRTGLAGDRFSLSSTSVPHAKLVQDLTDIKIRGLYQTPETAYTLNGAYSWDSGSNWNDKVYLDALVTDQFDDNYDNKAAGSITSNNHSPQLTAFTVDKPAHNDMLVVWEFDTEPEVFSSALVYGTAYIEVADNDNFTKTYFDEAYNYAKDRMTATAWTPWGYNLSLGDHNNVGGVGYFSSEYIGPGGPQSNNPIPNHTVYTQNNEYRTYAIRNKVWQSDVDIKVSNFVQNTGAGITEHIYQQRGRDNHDMNYNLYYTIDVENPKATIFEDKQQSANGQSKSDQKTTPYNTSSDVYEFDVNNMISWGSTGASQTGASYGNTTVVDHIKTGRTYIQREIPTVLATMTELPKASMNFKIYPNHDRLIYEDPESVKLKLCKC